MGILLRSAIVIGVIVYLSPTWNDPPTESSSARKQSAGEAVSGAANTLWQTLPESARKTVTDTAKKQILNEVSNNLLPVTGSDNAPTKVEAPPQTARKR